MRLLPIALLLCLTLAACGRDEAPAPATDGARATTDAVDAAGAAAAAAEADAALPPLPTGDFRVVSVSLGRAIDAEGLVAEPQDTFRPADKVHAAVVGIGSSDGLTLSAKWTAPDGSEIARAGQSLAPTAPTVTTFAIAQPQPWPTGEYRVEIAVNDRVVETRSFRVE